MALPTYDKMSGWSVSKLLALLIGNRDSDGAEHVLSVDIGQAVKILLRKLSTLSFVPTSTGPALQTTNIGGTLATLTTLTTATTLQNAASVTYLNLPSMGVAQRDSTQAYEQSFRRNLVQS